MVRIHQLLQAIAVLLIVGALLTFVSADEGQDSGKRKIAILNALLDESQYDADEAPNTSTNVTLSVFVTYAS